MDGDGDEKEESDKEREGRTFKRVLGMKNGKRQKGARSFLCSS